jgi:hypothetical protein
MTAMPPEHLRVRVSLVSDADAFDALGKHSIVDLKRALSGVGGRSTRSDDARLGLWLRADDPASAAAFSGRDPWLRHRRGGDRMDRRQS